VLLFIYEVVLSYFIYFKGVIRSIGSERVMLCYEEGQHKVYKIPVGCGWKRYMRMPFFAIYIY
jgi:hypothetical protein